MSKLSELIKELCPEGVEFKPLGAVAKIKNGRDYKHLAEGDIPVYGSGGIMTYVDSFTYDKPSVLLPRKGSLNNVFFVDVPFWNVDTIFYTEINENIMLPKFFYYLMAKENLAELNMAGGVPSLTQTTLNSIKIPVPPLAVQEEIVKILDLFADYAAELQAELQARKEQYEYYRNLLLTFNPSACGSGAEEAQKLDNVSTQPSGTYNTIWRPMGAIGTFIRGNGLQKKDFTESGVGCIHYGQIYTYYGTFATKTKSYVSPNFATKLKKASHGDIVIATTSENVEDVGKAVAWLGNNDIAVSGDAYIFKHNQNPKYIAYLFQTHRFDDFKKMNVTGTKVTRISGDALAKFEIPVPPLEEQARIVSILDRFEALTNDLQKGLPAEIAAVKEQYEYYRNKLLTFKQLA